MASNLRRCLRPVKNGVLCPSILSGNTAAIDAAILSLERLVAEQAREAPELSEVGASYMLGLKRRWS